MPYRYERQRQRKRQALILERRSKLEAINFSPKKRPHAYDSVKDQIQHNIAIDPVTGCWIWTLVLNHGGYGFISINSKNKYVHRVAYEEYNGDIPEDRDVGHKCDVPYCCNPAHLELVTEKQNTQQMMERGRQVKTTKAKGNWRHGKRKGLRVYINGTERRWFMFGQQPQGWTLAYTFNSPDHEYQMSEEQRARISERQKRVWRERKARLSA